MTPQLFLASSTLRADQTALVSIVMKETLTLLNHLSAFYIDMTRDSLYSDSPDLPSRQIVLSVFQAVSHPVNSIICHLRLLLTRVLISNGPPQVLNNVSQAVAPIAPFMIEELAEHRKDVTLPAHSAFSQRWRKSVSLPFLSPAVESVLMLIFSPSAASMERHSSKGGHADSSWGQYLCL